MKIRNDAFATAAVLQLLSACALHAADIATDWQHAEELNKAQPRDRIVLLTGSDWDPLSSEVASILDNDEFLLAVGDAIVLRIDHPDNPDDQAESLLERNEKFKAPIYCYPALVAVDAEGYFFGVHEKFRGDFKQAAALVKDWIAQRKARDEQLDLARNLEGTQRAELLGRALDAMNFKLAKRQRRIINELKKLDPEDTTGYVYKYTFNPYGFAEGKIAWAEPDVLSEAFRETEQMLKNNRITIEQRQTIYALRHGILSRQNAPSQERIDNLNRLIELDPTSDHSTGAHQLIRDINRAIEYDKAYAAYQKKPQDPTTRQAFIEVASVKLGELPQLPAARDPLVSSQGTLSFSSLSGRYDKPLHHILIPTDRAPGAFHTNSEVEPWASIDLQREFMVSCIAVVHNTGNRHRLIPLAIETSLDGETWTVASRYPEADKLYLVNLEDKSVRARYVRARRDSKRKDYFHLSNFLVWGVPAE